jgi:hypothetical protein
MKITRTTERMTHIEHEGRTFSIAGRWTDSEIRKAMKAKLAEPKTHPLIGD